MDTKNNTNPNADYFQPGQGGNPVVPPTITPESLQSTAPISLPDAPAPTNNAMSQNTSVPTPVIPTVESIVNDGTSQTPAEATQKGILGRIADAIKNNKTKTTLQNEAETSAGIPALTKTVNDLSTKLQGLNDQSTALQNEAQYTIPNKAQLDATGRGITTGGLAPLTTAQLRENQIKQGTIATQALTIKSALYGAQGNLALAKDSADKASEAQFEQEQQQIDYQKAQLDAITPTLNKEEKAQAQIVLSKLQDRQTQIDNAKEDKKTIIALATATLKNYPNDPQAHYLATQALTESNSQSPNLGKVLGLIEKYQTDPIAIQKAILDMQLTRSQINKNNASSVIDTANNIDIPGLIATIKNPNETQSSLGGLTVNGLQQKAQTYMTNNGNIQGLGLSSTGNSGIQRTLIANYAGYLADKLGMTIPQITQLYKANSKAVSEVTSRIAKIDTTSNTLVNQFPRLQTLATNVGNLGITESDLTKGKADVARKFGSVDAGNYVELIQTIRGDYSAMQASIGGSRGGTFFAQTAQEAIPLGLTPEQYAGLAQTIKQSADIASQSSADEVKKLAGISDSPNINNNSGAIISIDQIPPGYYQASDGLLYKK